MTGRSHEARGSNSTRGGWGGKPNAPCSNFTESPLKTTCQCLCGRRFTRHFMPSVLLCCWHTPPTTSSPPTHTHTHTLYDSSQHSCKYPPGSVCSAGLHDSISMCCIGSRDGVSAQTATGQMKSAPGSRLTYKLYIFIHTCKNGFAGCVEQRGGDRTSS